VVNVLVANSLRQQSLRYGITREDCDKWAIRSQTTWGEANEKNIFDAEITGIEVKGRKGTVTVAADEHPKPSTLLEKIASLRPVFKKDGVVTAASASGICDGAGTIILASEEAVKEHNLTPLCRLVSYNRRVQSDAQARLLSKQTPQAPVVAETILSRTNEARENDIKCSSLRFCSLFCFFVELTVRSLSFASLAVFYRDTLQCWM